MNPDSRGSSGSASDGFPRDPRPARAVLFDIDGTLLHTAGAGRRALTRTLASRLGTPPEWGDYDLCGRTDLEILRDQFRRAGTAAPAPEEMGPVVESFAAYLQEECRLGPPGAACPGVPALLEALARDPSWTVALLTGNVRRGAAIKLRHYSLERFFLAADELLGAFGDDHEDRNRLVPVALRRIEQTTGRGIAPRRTVVVGDTERDIACGRAAGARVLAVASGFRSLEQLRAAQPDALLPDLGDAGAVLACLDALTRD